MGEILCPLFLCLYAVALNVYRTSHVRVDVCKSSCRKYLVTLRIQNSPSLQHSPHTDRATEAPLCRQLPC